MGQFSWLDCLTGKQILDNVAKTSYLLVPERFAAKYGSRIEESCYDGYGHFGKYDVYELIQEWNREQIPEICELINAGKWKGHHYDSDIENLMRYYRGEPVPDLRWIGILMSCYDEDNFRLNYPIKITYDPDAIYEQCPPSKSDPNQGWRTDEDGDDDDYGCDNGICACEDSEKRMVIEIDIEKDDIYISNDGGSGCQYTLKSREELKKAICDYIDNADELDGLLSEEAANPPYWFDISNIEWDTEEDEENNPPLLPDNVTLSAGDLTLPGEVNPDPEILKDRIADCLSDHYGYCIKSFAVEIRRKANSEDFYIKR